MYTKTNTFPVKFKKPLVSRWNRSGVGVIKLTQDDKTKGSTPTGTGIHPRIGSDLAIIDIDGSSSWAALSAKYHTYQVVRGGGEGGHLYFRLEGEDAIARFQGQLFFDSFGKEIRLIANGYYQAITEGSLHPSGSRYVAVEDRGSDRTLVLDRSGVDHLFETLAQIGQLKSGKNTLRDTQRRTTVHRGSEKLVTIPNASEGRLMHCPFHDDENPSAFWNPEEQNILCMAGCGHGGEDGVHVDGGYTLYNMAHVGGDEWKVIAQETWKDRVRSEDVTYIPADVLQRTRLPHRSKEWRRNVLVACRRYWDVIRDKGASVYEEMDFRGFLTSLARAESTHKMESLGKEILMDRTAEWMRKAEERVRKNTENLYKTIAPTAWHLMGLVEIRRKDGSVWNPDVTQNGTRDEIQSYKKTNGWTIRFLDNDHTQRVHRFMSGEFWKDATYDERRWAYPIPSDIETKQCEQIVGHMVSWTVERLSVNGISNVPWHVVHQYHPMPYKNVGSLVKDFRRANGTSVPVVLHVQNHIESPNPNWERFTLDSVPSIKITHTGKRKHKIDIEAGEHSKDARDHLEDAIGYKVMSKVKERLSYRDKGLNVEDLKTTFEWSSTSLNEYRPRLVVRVYLPPHTDTPPTVLRRGRRKKRTKPLTIE